MYSKLNMLGLYGIATKSQVEDSLAKIMANSLYSKIMKLYFTAVLPSVKMQNEVRVGATVGL